MEFAGAAVSTAARYMRDYTKVAPPCKYCGHQGMQWGEHKGGWRMFDNGKLHSCDGFTKYREAKAKCNDAVLRSPETWPEWTRKIEGWFQLHREKMVGAYVTFCQRQGIDHLVVNQLSTPMQEKLRHFCAGAGLKVRSLDIYNLTLMVKPE